MFMVVGLFVGCLFVYLRPGLLNFWSSVFDTILEVTFIDFTEVDQVPCENHKW